MLTLLGHANSIAENLRLLHRNIFAFCARVFSGTFSGNERIADCGLAIADCEREYLFSAKSAIRNPQSEIRNLVAAEGRLGDSHQIIARRTDAPDEFIYGAAISAMAAVIGRKRNLRFAGRGLTPCLWVVLLGRSSKLRKSTVLELTRKIVISATTPSTFSFLPQTSSMESFIDRMGAIPEGPYGNTGWLVQNEFEVG